MPRKDPETGCNVMTTMEFIKSEADREGIEPSAVLDDIFSSLEEDSCRVEEYYKNNPDEFMREFLPSARDAYEAAFDDLKAYEETNPEDRFSQYGNGEKKAWEKPVLPPYPLAVVELLEVKFSQSFGSRKLQTKGTAICSDGVKRVFLYSHTEWSATRMEPGDCDFTLEWKEIDENYSTSTKLSKIT